MEKVVSGILGRIGIDNGVGGDVGIDALCLNE